jgi:hypothetical protein
MNEDGHQEPPVLDVNGGDRIDVGVSSLCSSPPASRRVPQSDIAMFMDHCGKDEKGNLLTDTSDHMSNSNRERSPARRKSPTLNDVHSSKILPRSFLLLSLFSLIRYRCPPLSIVRLHHVNQK